MDCDSVDGSARPCAVGEKGEHARTFYGRFEWWLYMEELRCFGEVAVEVMFVEHVDGL